MELLQEYDYEILYKPGKQNVVADAPSRRPDLQISAISVVSVNPGIISDIKKAYSEDNHFKDVFVALSNGDSPIPGNLEVKSKRY